MCNTIKNISLKTATSAIASKYYGFFIIFLATTLFSSKAILIKLSYNYGATPDIMMGLRMIMSLPFYLIIAIQAHHSYSTTINGRSYFAIGLFGLSGYYAASALDLYGLQYISASLERIILYTYPSIVIILSALFLGERIKRSIIFCIVIIYCGLLITFLQDSTITNISETNSLQANYILGCGMVLMSALMFAIYLCGSSYMMRKLPSRLFTAYSMIAACAAIGLHVALKQPIDVFLHLPAPIYLLGFIIAIFCTVLPSFMLSAGIQSVGASAAGAIGSLGPISTLVIANIVLNETLTTIQLVGFLIVLTAVVALSKLR